MLPIYLLSHTHAVLFIWQYMYITHNVQHISIFSLVGEWACWWPDRQAKPPTPKTEKEPMKQWNRFFFLAGLCLRCLTKDVRCSDGACSKCWWHNKFSRRQPDLFFDLWTHLTSYSRRFLSSNWTNAFCVFVLNPHANPSPFWRAVVFGNLRHKRAVLVTGMCRFVWSWRD